MVSVIAHRGVWSDTVRENSLAALSHALQKHFFIETDMRVTRDRKIVLSHDGNLTRLFGNPSLIGEKDAADLPEICAGDVFFQHLRRHKSTAFIHVKELSALSILADLITRSGTTGHCILFEDGANTCAFSERCRQAFPGLRTALHLRSLSDCEKARTVTSNALWLDEETAPWITKSVLFKIKSGSAGIYIVSPEVWGSPLDRSNIEGLWQRWAHWGVDGICSDWPDHLQTVINVKVKERARNT